MNLLVYISFSSSVSPQFCDEIADMRKLLQAYAEYQIVFIDESHIRICHTMNKTLVLPGDLPIIEVEEMT